MKKLLHIQVIVTLITVVMPTTCMKKDRIINFAGDFNVISIKESHLQMMGAWDSHYKKHKIVADKGGILPGFPNVSADELELVNDALSVGAYKFGEYFNDTKLSSNDRRLLVEASGLYGDDGKRLKLYVPELTTQLIDAYFPDGLRDYIKSFCKQGDYDAVRNYCRKQLIFSKRWLLPLKQAMLNDTCNQMRNDIYPGSFFLNGYHTNHADSPIPLAIAETIHQTYASHFVTDTHEHRITDIKGKRCSLWVINHDHIYDKNYTFSTSIEHKGDIKGCMLSKTGTGVEYAVTYSDCDVVVSKITTQDDISFVELFSKPASKNSTIVDICFNHAHDRLIIGKYEGMSSTIGQYTIDLATHIKPSIHISFKIHGLLEKMFTYRTSEGNFLLLIFGVTGQYGLHFHRLADNGVYEFSSLTELRNLSCRYCDTYDIFKRGDSIVLYDWYCSSFEESFIEEQGRSKESWFIKELVDRAVVQLNPDCYRIYSPDGKFLLCNTLKKRSGTVYVETVVKDAVTHTQILAIDTFYKNFVGIGFSLDGTGLIFLNSVGPNYYVSLLNAEDNALLQEMEKVVLSNLGIASLFKRLCMECQQKDVVALYEDSPTYTMLMDWARTSPHMKSLLEKCLPLSTLKK